jgi:Ca-activated chloride channel family protein
LEKAAMSFGNPFWLWALLVWPLLAFFFAQAEQRGAERLQKFVAARLLPQLAGTVNLGRRIFRFVLLLLVLALVIISLARPRWGYSYDEVKRKGLDLLIAVDVSRSMLSNDVQPSRLDRVKLATQDLINELQGDRFGLIAFAGRSFLQAPLTIDYDAAVDSINELDTKIIPEGGTNIADAIALATRTFGKTAIGNRALIIFTDGEDLSGDAVSAAKAAADAGVQIFTVGVGTPSGSLIPIQSDSGGTAFVKDEKGEVVKSKLDETRLREIAQAANGFYLHLENGPRTMQQLFNDGLAKMQVADINARLSRQPIERYQWPLAAAILFFAIALLINDRKGGRKTTSTGGTGALPSGAQKLGRHRGRPSTAVAVLISLLAVVRMQAASEGLDLYNRQKFPEAYEHFEKTLKENPGARVTDRIHFDAGAAAYKMKDYNKALQSFSQALLSKNPHLQSESHYNLGNTLYERGEAEKSDEKKLSNWESALPHYEETLKAEPQNQNAKDNYEYVKKKIEELKKKQEQKKQDQKPPPSPSPSPSPSPQKDQNNDQKQQDKNQQQDKNDQKDQQQQSQDNQGKGNGQKSEKNQSSPSPTPTPTPEPSPGQTASPSPSPGEEKQNEGAGQSPTPSPTPGEQPESSPTPGNEGTPSPTPGSGDESGNENGEQPSPSPASTPAKNPTGDVKGANEEKPKENEQAEQAETEPEKEGEMSPKQAAALLESMKDEEQKVQLDEHRRVRPVYKDW